jgi:hypothetical protein
VNWEQLRRRYQPPQVRILLIGESPPASGRFFYQRDSGLYRAVRDAFQIFDSSTEEADFLDVFQASGCYLIDLSKQPVDALRPADRRAACREGEAALARSIRRLKPGIVVTLLKSIRPNVERAAAAAKWSGPVLEVSYPGRWKKHREAFLAAFVPILKGVHKGIEQR